jgi:hypothetical protein
LLVDDEKLRAVFATMDTNGDGQLSLAELVGQVRAHAHARPLRARNPGQCSPRPLRARLAVRTRSRAASAAVSAAFWGRQLDGDPVVYDLIAEGDADRDGKLSLAEFRAVMKKHILKIKGSFAGAPPASPKVAA